MIRRGAPHALMFSCIQIITFPGIKKAPDSHRGHSVVLGIVPKKPADGRDADVDIVVGIFAGHDN